MSADPSHALHRLAAERFSTAEAALASGTTLATFAQRIKEGRMPMMARRTGTGNRRLFTLTDVYAARLCEALSRGAGLALGDAKAVVAEASEELRAIPAPLDLWPPEWPETWRRRDAGRPVLLLVVRYLQGWRTTFAAPGETIESVVARLPKPPGRSFLPISAPAADVEADETEPMALVLLNLTRELRAVDRALLACRPDLAEESTNAVD